MARPAKQTNKTPRLKMYLFRRTIEGATGKGDLIEVLLPEIADPLGAKIAQYGTGQLNDPRDVVRVKLVAMSSLDQSLRQITAKRSVSTADIAKFFLDVATLNKSGISIGKAILLCAKGAKSPRLRGVLACMYYEHATLGKPLPEVMERFPDLFDEATIMLVRAGERSGRTEDVLELLGKRAEQCASVVNRVKTKMIYPACVGVAGLGVCIFILYYVMPDLAKGFASFNKNPPPITKLVLAFSHFLQSPLGIAMPFVLLAILWAFRREIIKGPIGLSVIRWRVVGALYRGVVFVRSVGSLAMLLNSGEGMAPSLKLAAKIAGHPQWEGYYIAIAKRVENGEPPDLAFAKEQWRVGDDGYLISDKVDIGSQSGNISKGLDALVALRQKDVEAAAETLPEFVNPLIMVIVGACVGFVFVAVMVTNLTFALEISK